MNFIIVLCATLLPAFYSSIVQDEGCTARSRYGILQGKHMISRSGRLFCTFQGVPYAKPPIGELRFLPPTSPEPWEGTRDSTKEASICLQRKSGGSEDCLYLNIFTHNVQTNKPVTVMVFIHGGGFHLGSSSVSVLGPEFLMVRDIVLVTLQYRLGPFGFLSTEDAVVPGNMGLKDHVKALQWVQENIEAFGGDNKRVTIFGNSAGGAAVHYHMLSPLSRDLFTRGISQSGSALSSFAMTSKGKAKNDTATLALNLNCSIDNSTEILACLQNKSSQDILQAFNNQFKSKYGMNKLFRPVVEVPTEHAFLTSSPWLMTTEKPWLIGVNTNEGLFKIKTSKINETLKLVNSEFNTFSTHFMFIYDLYSNLDEIANLTYSFYFKNTSQPQDILVSLEKMVTDSWFAWPTTQAMLRHNGPLFSYLYDHQAEHTYLKIYDLSRSYGVAHTDELLVLFTQRAFFPELNQQDTNISKMMVDFWVNFASEGNPTPNAISRNPQQISSEDFTWQSSNNSDFTYLHIQTNGLSMKKKMFSNRMDFWQQLPLKRL